MSKKNNPYIGKSGHLYVMSRFLLKGWNVSIPEVDVGDDIFVVEDESGDLYRVQVKTGKVRFLKNKTDYSVYFSVKLKQLRAARLPNLFYCFVGIVDEGFSEIICIAQKALYELFDRGCLGEKNIAGNLTPVLKCKKGDFLFGDEILNDYRGLSKFKNIPH